MLGDGFGSLGQAGRAVSSLHITCRTLSLHGTIDAVESKGESYSATRVCSRGDAVLRTEPAVQVDFATYGLILKQSFKEMSKVMFSDTFVQHLYNILQPFIGISFEI